MVLSHHRVCRGTAQWLRPPDGVAGARLDHAAELDRKECRRGGGFSAGRALAGFTVCPHLYHPSGHHLRGYLHEPCARVAAGGTGDLGAAASVRGAGVRGACLAAGEGHSDSRGSRKRRRVHGSVCDQPLHQDAYSNLGGELRAVRIRDRSHHGSSRPRPARFRLRQEVRHSCAARYPKPGRHAEW